MLRIKIRMQLILFSVIAACFLTGLIVITVDRIFFHVNKQNNLEINNTSQPLSIYKINFADTPKYQIIPYYLDLDVGDVIQVVKHDGSETCVRVIEIKAESRRYSCPRVRVTVRVDGQDHFAYCGMIDAHEGGIGPLELNGIKIGVEITELVFSKINSKNKSPFHNYRNFKLSKDLRLALWDGNKPIMKNTEGTFVVNQPLWTRNKFGNWLHRTKYGMHTAIDIYASRHGVPEGVLSPVDAVVYKVYNKDADVDSKIQSKAINIYGDAVVGPKGENILYRFHHLSKILVSTGDHVKKGQVIGLTGHTGFDARIGDHLHFEMRLNPSCFGKDTDTDIFASVPVNPYYYLLEWWEKRAKR
ncbi:hypothetical protein AMJ44_02280 [candidate division WOR-1 bacterium DG_54_3]|uniref:M23ase beta-sheet core domain-containing protein n=1 Tax=candidate division WOR-1 bacterium DG_54_3 TaxID=1703775 RepID=A0A0S7Y511_UNCSA|nr:MAG: hypothetical protein AMJ44_02280 [candidate division WOR-1 bacterium DG_54_3]